MSYERRNPASDYSRSKVRREFDRIVSCHKRHPRFSGWYSDIVFQETVGNPSLPYQGPPDIEHEPDDSGWRRKARIGAAVTALFVTIAGTAVAVLPIVSSPANRPGVVETTPGPDSSEPGPPASPGAELTPVPLPTPSSESERCLILHLPPGCFSR